MAGKNEGQGQEVTASSLARPHPDSVLLDDGNPDTLLGAESDAEDAAEQARKRLSKALELTSEMDANPAMPASSTTTTYAAPKPNRASAVFTAGSTAPDDDQEDPGETIAALQAHIKDLTAQVTGLNGKLVGSFERVADLEDEFSEAQRRLQSQTSKIQTLEKERSEHLAALNTGLLVEKENVSSEMQRMMDRVMEETKQRGKAENDKKRIEEELEQLSASLFAEANRMVAVEKLARARAEEKSGSMEKGLKDTEGIMLEQQKVLASLQRQVEELQQGGLTSDSTSLMPGLKIESLARSPSQRTSTLGGSTGKRRASIPAGVQILINIQPFSEFVSFMGHLRKQRLGLRHFYTYPLPGRQSRSASPAPNAITAVAASTTGAATGGHPPVSPSPSQGSLNPFAIAGVSRHKDYPSLPTSAESLVQISSQSSLPFIKRAQEEDSDPCLRLDLAPGLNWLTRRQANTAILEGNLVIEPIFPGGVVPDADEIRAQNAHLPPAACALCGAAVINVPLGGGTGNGMYGPESGDHQQKHSGSWASSFSAVTGSAATSMLEAAGVRDKSKSSGTSSAATAPEKAERDGAETPTAAKARTPGLFSGLRLGAASPKPERSTGSSLAQRLPGLAIGSSQSETEDSLRPILPRSTVIPPIPTHIFRLSDSSNARYLLCPHHCLDRLRAVCAFYSWLRALERSIILEGKCPWEEDPAYAMPQTPKTPQARRGSAAPDVSMEKDLPPVMERTDTTGDAVEKLEEQAEAAAEGGLRKEGADDSDSGGKAEKENAEQKASEESDPRTDEPGSGSESASSFRDAAEKVSGESDEDGTPPSSAPPVPPRKSERRPVPPLPPHSAQANGQELARVQPTPPPLVIARSMIPLHGGEDLNWAEKLWQEVIKHKDDMYRARMGFRTVFAE